jgi:hypothetical protein
MYTTILKRLDREIERVDDQDIAIIAREEGSRFPKRSQRLVCRHLAWSATQDASCLRAYLTYFTSKQSSKILATASQYGAPLPAQDPVVAHLLLSRPDVLVRLCRGSVTTALEPFAKAGYGRLVNPLMLSVSELRDRRLELERWLVEQPYLPAYALCDIIRRQSSITLDEHEWLTDLISRSSYHTMLSEQLEGIPIIPR